MQAINQLNNYNFQAIIALNDHLIGIKKLDTIFEYISSYLEKDYSIKYFLAEINSNELFRSFEENDESITSFDKREILVKLSNKEELAVKIFFDTKDEENIKSSLTLVKTTFSVISQTIYNKYLQFKINEMTLKDSLTGLYNRQYIDEYLKSTLALSQRENHKMAFLKVGIDHFKAVIDEFDYVIGDKVLKELAKSLEQSVRKSDIIARIDSDEFLIVLHNVTNEENAIMVADKIINNFKDVNVIVNEETNQTLKKTICTGISIYPDDADKIEEIFRSSDIALYEARNKGRSQFFKFQKEADTIELF